MLYALNGPSRSSRTPCSAASSALARSEGSSEGFPAISRSGSVRKWPAVAIGTSARTSRAGHFRRSCAPVAAFGGARARAWTDAVARRRAACLRRRWRAGRAALVPRAHPMGAPSCVASTRWPVARCRRRRACWSRCATRCALATPNTRPRGYAATPRVRACNSCHALSLTRGPGAQREWLAAQEEQRARVCGLQASLAQLAARRSTHHDAPETPAFAALTDGGDDSALAAKYRRVKAAARAAAARVAQLQGAPCASAFVSCRH